MVSTKSRFKSYLFELCSASICLAASIVSCIADGQAPPNLDFIFDKESTYYSHILSMTFSATETVVVTDNNRKETVVKSIDFDQDGAKFNYNYRQTDDKDNSLITDYSTYDGESFQHFIGNCLHVSKGAPDQISSLFDKLYVTMPFEFVRSVAAIAHKGESEFVLRPDQLKLPTYWALCRSNIVSVSKGSLQGKSGIIVEFPGRYFDNDVNISVLFDPTHDFYPVAWERYSTNDKNTGETYVINMLGTVSIGTTSASLYYHKDATLTQYCGSPSPCASSEIVVSKISINKQNKDDSRFTIDPATANYIFDADSKTMITVPK